MEFPHSAKTSRPSDEEVHREQLGDVTLSLRQSENQTNQECVESDPSDLRSRLKEAWQSNASLKNQLANVQQQLEGLHKQLERYQIAAQGSREGFWEGHPLPDKPWNSPETPAWYSPQFIALLGFEEHEFPPVLGTWESLIHPEDRDRVFAALTAHIEDHVPYEVDSRLRTKHGEYRWFKGKGQAIFDSEGKFLRGGGTIRDITDQKRAEERLKKKHALLTAVVEGTSDVLFVKDGEGRYVLVNPSAASLLGKRVEEMVGKTDSELFPDGTHPLFSQGDADVRRGEGSKIFETEVVERQAVSRTFLVTKKPFGFSQTGKNGVLGFAHDITFRKAAELTIQEREKRYRAIMENAYDLIAEIDVHGQYLYVSPNFKEVLGYTSKDLLGSNIFVPVHPDDREAVIAEFQRSMASEGDGQAIYRYMDRQGAYRWFESTGRVFRTALGELRGVVVSRDITQRKLSEDALEAIVRGNVVPGSPNFFEILVAELAKVLNVSMVLLSERLEADSGKKARVLAFWNLDHFEPPSEYDCLDGPCEQVLAGHSVDFASGVRQLFPKSATIQTLAIEAYFGIPLVNSKNEVVGNLAIMDTRPFHLSSQGKYLLEIFAARAGTELERKRVQEDLQKSQDQYRALYDQTPLIYLTVDCHGTVLSVNHYGAQLLGYEVEELMGTSVFAVVHPNDRTLFQSGMEKSSRESMKGIIPEFRKMKKDGTLLWVRETIQAIDSLQGQKVLLLSCEDITEKKRTEEALVMSEQQLRHTQKMEAIGTLAGGIAHDFNNILGAILGYSELAVAQASHDSRLKSYLAEVIAAGQRARDLVKQILAFSRRSEQNKEAVDLQLLVKDVLKMIRASFPASVEIRTSLDLRGSAIYADSTQIQQVIMNLCGNAEYAMREHGGVLDISLSRKELPGEVVMGMSKLKAGPYLELTVRDTGKGIPQETIDRIFEPFFTTKESGEGTGLGLAVVHGIVHNHGGGIGVSSIPDKGTAFTVLFPRLDVVVPVKSEEIIAWPKGSGNILFVDDEEMLTRWGTQLLTHLGYAVVSSMNPYEALEWFRSTPEAFDVVVTDQTMPTMSGDAFSRALLAVRPDIPILLCTGFSHTMSPEKAKHLGIRAFLMKPVNGKSLAIALREILDQSVSADDGELRL
ncbi:MAG: PAS domain S-box protein [Nitrospirales bacterium]|nr:PAS domain S-box protein [Nitrospirales bacterium]